MYALDSAALAGLRPDVVVTQGAAERARSASTGQGTRAALIKFKPRADACSSADLCAVCAVDLKAVQRCAAGARVVSLNPFTVQDMLGDILRCGEAMHTERQAQAAVARLQARIDRAAAAARGRGNGCRLRVGPLEARAACRRMPKSGLLLPKPAREAS